jgi:ABC-2 type transport system permease protein
MSASGIRRVGSVTTIGAELRKLPAFMRRDLLIALSYRAAFVTDWLSMIAQIVMFYFVGRIVDPGTIPDYGGTQTSYMEFVAVGITVSSFMAVGLGRIFAAVRQEQVLGTLETLLLTPTALTTVQIGSVVYDLAYVPIRTSIFLGLTSLIFGTSFDWSGLAPTALVLISFVPFVWGLGVLAAAWTLTFKRGTGVVGIATSVLTVGSGAYFPLDVVPGWARGILRWSPVTIALEGARDALLGGAGFADLLPSIAILVPFAAASLVVGVVAFRTALERERRRGSLGLY